MVITDSTKIYEKACYYGRQLSQAQQGYSQNQSNGYSYVDGYSGSNYNQSVDLETYYVQIIGTMFYELITKKTSDLLSLLCSVNDIRIETVNYKIKYQSYNFKRTYDLMPIIDGLNTAFSKSLEECSYLFITKYKKDIFQGKAFNQGFDYVNWITDALRTLDDNIDRTLSAPTQSGDDKVKRDKTSKAIESKTKESKTPETILRIHDPKLTDKLNQFADNRRANDFAMSEQIQQLQVSLQDELKQIMAIREGIDYNISQEAISQFLSLFALLSETLQYHPKDENKDSYHNLIESCEDFLENIKQSLAMLGVTTINDVGKPFDPEKHKTVRGMQPTRSATISKVIKIGFAYKNRVLEKAEVELS